MNTDCTRMLSLPHHSHPWQHLSLCLRFSPTEGVCLATSSWVWKCLRINTQQHLLTNDWLIFIAASSLLFTLGSSSTMDSTQLSEISNKAITVVIHPFVTAFSFLSHFLTPQPTFPGITFQINDIAFETLFQVMILGEPKLIHWHIWVYFYHVMFSPCNHTSLSPVHFLSSIYLAIEDIAR